MSSFGSAFRVTTWGESHAKTVGCVIDGCPPGLELTVADIQPQLTRRRPGQSKLTTPRDEADAVAIHAGTEEGLTLGTPLCLVVQNTNVRPGDYAEMINVPRPGHADFTYQVKYGLAASSGGGRASARETIGRVAAGAVAEKFLVSTYGPGVQIVSFVTSVGDVEMPADEIKRAYTRDEVDALGTLRFVRGRCRSSTFAADRAEAKDEACFVQLLAVDARAPAYCGPNGQVYTRDGEVLEGARVDAGELGESVAVRCPHAPTACRMATLIRVVKSENDSIGGTVACVCRGVPRGLGEPCFDKLEAMMAHAMMSLPATKGFEIGLGFKACALRGSQHNDAFASDGRGGIAPATNNAGGTLGGISTGEPLVMRIAVKPVSTIGRAQKTSTYAGESAVLEAKGRHDPCVLPRCPPLMEAMAALVLADMALIQRQRLGGARTTPDVIDQAARQSSASPRGVNGDAKRVKL